MSGSSAAHSPNAAGVPRRVETGCRPGDVPWVHGSECRVLGPLFSGGLRSSDPRGTVKLSRICPFFGRILLDQRLRINGLAVAAGGENAAKLLNLTVPTRVWEPFQFPTKFRSLSLEAIDMDSYRVEVRATMAIALP